MTKANPPEEKLLEHIRASDPLETISSPSEVEAAAAWTRILALESSTRRDTHTRVTPRTRRHKLLRTGGLSLAALAVLSGSALAAGNALGIIDLGGGVSAAPVTTIPVWDGTTGTFVNVTVGSTTSAAGSYAYHITGGTFTVACPFTNPTRYVTESNDSYVTSTRPLTTAELQQLVDLHNNPQPINSADTVTTRNEAGQEVKVALIPGTPAYAAAQQNASTWAQLDADGVVSEAGFNDPIGAGCFGPGNEPGAVPTGTAQAGPTTVTPTNRTRIGVVRRDGNN